MLYGTLTKGVRHLTISSNGKYLAASDLNNCICIYNFDKIINDNKGHKFRATDYLVATGKGAKTAILDL